jgi:RNA 3'-terminal phosphate cyclase (ATP)
MRQSALKRLPPEQNVRIEADCLGDRDAVGRGGAIVLWAHFGHTILGAGRVAAIGVGAETLGEEAAAELVADIESGASVDVHAADQLLIYAALARGGAFLTRMVSPHASTAMWLIEQFLPIRFSVAAHAGLHRVSVAGI